MKLPYEYTQDHSNIPYYAAQDQFDEMSQLILGARRSENFTISTHRRELAGFGTTVPTPVVAGYVAIIQMRPGGKYDMLCDARHDTRSELRTGYTKVLDMRQLWVADLNHPFHSFSFVIPQALFDELSEDLGHGKIERFRCLPSDNVVDPVMLNLARAIYPAFRQDGSLSALASAHIFQAACVHLAQSYGGLRAETTRLRSGLSRWQERRVKEMMADDLRADMTIEELSDASELTPYRLAQSFSHSVGMPMHRWLMERRIESAKSLLACTTQSIEEIAAFCGFHDLAHMDRMFQKTTQLSSTKWRANRRN